MNTDMRNRLRHETISLPVEQEVEFNLADILDNLDVDMVAEYFEDELLERLEKNKLFAAASIYDLEVLNGSDLENIIKICKKLSTTPEFKVLDHYFKSENIAAETDKIIADMDMIQLNTLFMKVHSAIITKSIVEATKDLQRKTVMMGGNSAISVSEKVEG